MHDLDIKEHAMSIVKFSWKI